MGSAGDTGGLCAGWEQGLQWKWKPCSQQAPGFAFRFISTHMDTREQKFCLVSCPFPGAVAAPAAQLSLLPAAGNILLCCHRFPGCRRGEHLARCTIRAGDPDNFGKELCLFQGFSSCRNLSHYFEIKNPLGVKDWGKISYFRMFFLLSQRNFSSNFRDGNAVNYLLVHDLSIPCLL